MEPPVADAEGADEGEGEEGGEEEALVGNSSGEEEDDLEDIKLELFQETPKKKAAPGASSSSGALALPPPPPPAPTGTARLAHRRGPESNAATSLAADPDDDSGSDDTTANALDLDKVCKVCHMTPRQLTPLDIHAGSSYRPWGLKRCWGPLCRWCKRAASIRWPFFNVGKFVEWVEADEQSLQTPSTTSGRTTSCGTTAGPTSASAC